MGNKIILKDTDWKAIIEIIEKYYYGEKCKVKSQKANREVNKK